jgi:excinuclease ABC subunit A
MVDQVLAVPAGELALLLAPLVEERRGQHLQLLSDLAGRGFVRVRIDGVVHEIDAVPTLDPKRKHRIEAVVDRFRVRPEAAQRLAESFETALRQSGGIVEVIFPDNAALAPLLFSNRHACPVCGFSVPPLEPRMFSFNNPAGACPTCDGLGTQEFFDPERVVVHPHLSLAGGAVRGWDRRNEHYFQMLQSLARHYEFDVETPWTELPARVRDVLLNGSGEEQIEFEYREARVRRRRLRERFEGIMPNLERRYRETDSQAVREELRKYLGTRPCVACGGARLNEASRSVLISGRALHEVTHLTVGHALEYFASLQLPGWRADVALRITHEVGERLRFLVDVGLDYLSLDRSAGSLSGGEAQRIRLASQVGSGLTGVMYILDEPSIGLHQRDNERLLTTLKRLRDLGNTVIVVEHDEDAIRAADHVVDLGPGAGEHGGMVIAEGTPGEIEANPASLTGAYLARRERIAVPEQRRAATRGQWLTIRGARGNNLQNVTARIPIGLLTCVTGVSGSGKSTLVEDTLYRHAAARLNDSTAEEAAECDGIDGLERFERIVEIDQAPLGRTPRSNPATYTGLFAIIRDLFAQVPEARARGYDAGRFSFNVKGGRCEACQGDGVIRVEMHFLPDVYVPCDVCGGRRYNRETLEIQYRGHNIHQVLEATVEQALRLFENVPAAAAKLRTLMDVGLSYVRLGQSATTLSGGEAQRVKLARELAKRGTGNTLYILDEPTTGLHFHDIAQLLAVLHQLRDAGNTLVVIEHNLDVIKTADWVIDLGPGGGERGGRIIAEGTPEAICTVPESLTAQYLAPSLTQVASPGALCPLAPARGQGAAAARRAPRASGSGAAPRRSAAAPRR